VTTAGAAGLPPPAAGVPWSSWRLHIGISHGPANSRRTAVRGSDQAAGFISVSDLTLRYFADFRAQGKHRHVDHAFGRLVGASDTRKAPVGR